MADPTDDIQAPVAWREGVARRADTLGRYVEGRFVITPGQDDVAVAARRFFDHDFFQQTLARAAGLASSESLFEAGRNSPDELVNLHAHASRFMRHYAGSLSIAALVGLAEGIGLDTSIDRCTLIMWRNVPYRVMLDMPDSAVLRCAERSTSLIAGGPVLDTLAELRAEVSRKLYAEHVGPMIETIVEITKISPALLWTNTAEWIATISEAAMVLVGEETARRFLQDREALLEAEHLPGVPGEVNPLRDRLAGTLVSEDGSPGRYVSTRRLCCLTYLLEDRFGRLCGNCPHLPLEEKVALARERDHLPVGVPGGAAEKRAIERGLQRPSIQRLLNAKQHTGPEQPAGPKQ